MLTLLMIACSTDSSDPTTGTVNTDTASALTGTWSASEECGANAGGTPVAIYYTLTFSGQTATLHADGYQTMMRLSTTLKPSPGDTVTLVAEGAEPDSFPSYRKGQALLSLSLVADRSGATLTAHPVDLVLACSDKMTFTR